MNRPPFAFDLAGPGELSSTDALGDIWSDLPAIVAKIAVDPALPEVVLLIEEVIAINTDGGGLPSGEPGIGLSAAIQPLRLYLFVKRHPWTPYAAGAFVLVVPFLIGLLVGRKIED
jgi:hypothetical protein